MAWIITLFTEASSRSQSVVGGISILGGRDYLILEAFTILEMIKQYDLVLATYYISTRDDVVLVEEDRYIDISRIMVTHDTSISHRVGMATEDLHALALKGAFIEH